MSKRGVKVSFRKAGRTPSDRPKKKHPPQLAFENFSSNGRNPLNRYIVENEDSGLSMSELIEQFQEYDCVHKMEDYFIKFGCGAVELARRCEICFYVERKIKER